MKPHPKGHIVFSQPLTTPNKVKKSKSNPHVFLLNVNVCLVNQLVFWHAKISLAIGMLQLSSLKYDVARTFRITQSTISKLMARYKEINFVSDMPIS